jgi:hypothetical protein
MPPRILLLSGPLAVGKSSVAALLVDRGGFARVRSGKFLSDLAMKRGRTIDRPTLQELGDRLDLETDYRWLIDEVAVPAIAAHPTQDRWLVDAVRKDRQVAHFFRQEFPERVIHVHLTADEGVLRERYEARLRAGNDYEGNKSYDTAIRHPNELAARSLREIADHTIETNELRPERILEMLLNTLG